jgi:hypothetical protein
VILHGLKDWHSESQFLIGSKKGNARIVRVQDNESNIFFVVDWSLGERQVEESKIGEDISIRLFKNH